MAELAAPLAPLLGPARTDGVGSVAVIPILSDETVWGYFLLEHGYTTRFGHHRRRFAQSLGQLVSNAVRRVHRNTRQRAERLASEAVTTFEALVEEGSNALDALLFGDQLLATTGGGGWGRSAVRHGMRDRRPCSRP